MERLVERRLAHETQLCRYCTPGSASSARIRPEIAPPMMPADDREDQVESADVLVVRGHEPAGEEAGL
jgi:hypothetical protein